MFVWIATVLLAASTALVVAGLLARRAAPPPARRNELIVDWTREWRRALKSLDRPLPGERRRRRSTSRSSTRA
jgi:hypothetical protein